MSNPNKKPEQLKLLRQTVIYSALGFSLVAYAIAPRKVTIPAFSNSSSGSQSEGVVLFNGSPAAVTYQVTCYDKAGVSQFGPNQHTLNSKVKKIHGSTPLCSDGSQPSVGNGSNGGMVQCGWGSSSNASMCPTNFHLCSFSEVQANAGTEHIQRMGWTSNFSFTVSANWSTGYSSNSSMSYSEYSSGSGYIAVAVADSNAYCYSSSGGGGTSQQYCSASWNSPWMGNFCCPNAGAERAAQSCDVEIIDPTPASGFLQSPQFKGNSPF